MSAKSWLGQAYPTPAAECPKSKALEHTLLKWRHITPSMLKRHGLKKSHACILDKFDNEILRIGAGSCALCIYYNHDISCRSKDGEQCPIFKARNTRCHSGYRPPYCIWLFEDDARPMIELIRKTIRIRDKV